MKNIIFITLLLSFGISNISYACLPNGITLSTQEQIDDFETNYPGCTEIEGDLIIQGKNYISILNLNGLLNITKIKGKLIISGNENLKNLEGLNGLISIEGDLLIDYNYNLLSITALQNITNIKRDIRISNNKNLKSLNGFNSLKRINGSLNIWNNSAILNLKGLDSITYIEQIIRIWGNKSMINFEGLNKLTTINSIHIEDNLSIKNFSGLSGVTNINDFYVKGNATLKDFVGLVSLKSVYSLKVNSNKSLINFKGLDSITIINGTLSIDDNKSIINFNGLNNVKKIKNGFSISRNSTITNFKGLDSLKSIGSHFSISKDSSLINFSGLENIKSIGDFIFIKDNMVLSSLSGLQNIDPNTIKAKFASNKDLTIINNPKLSECEVQSICEFLDIPDRKKEIYENMNGCNSVEEIKNSCITLPECVSLINPSSNSNNVNVLTSIEWSSSSGATGYKITIGSTEQDSDLLNNYDVGNVTSYKPDTLPCNKSIFVTIVPYNSNGNAKGCTYQKFITESVTAYAGEDIEICLGDSIQLEATGGTKYRWFPLTGLDNHLISNPTAKPKNTTTYIVTVSVDGRCTQTDEVLVKINPSPIITIDSIRDIRIDPLGFIAISTNSSENKIYVWSGPNNFTSKTKDIYNLNDAGCYTLTVTDTITNCSIDSTICLKDYTATLNPEFGNINIYPNPTKGNFIIDFSDTRLNQAEITIFDLSGKQQLNFEKKSNKKIINVDLEILSAGLYITRIKSAKFGTTFRKLIISK